LGQLLFLLSPHPDVRYILGRLRLLAAPGTHQTAEMNIAAAACFQGALLSETWASEQVKERSGFCPKLITVSR